MPKKPSYPSLTDLFCGAGGSSLGTHAAGADVALALNHWELAIESHNTNFPNVAHDCVDVSAVDPRRYRSTDILWASPECTNHSISKGKKRQEAQMGLFDKPIINPAEERSRATMFDVPRFAEFHEYSLIVVENVVDVRDWRLWDAWIHAMTLLGYDHQEVYFNSMFAHLNPAEVQSLDDVVPQSRDRLYVVFWKRGHPAPNLDFRPVGWCANCAADVETVQAWKNGRRKGRYRKQYVYRCPRCAAEVEPWHFSAWNAIDWSLPAQRIGDRQRPLKERTMERIRKGLEKYGDLWLVIDTAYDGDRTRPVLAPLMTQTGRQTIGMVAPQLVSVNYYDDRTIPVTQAMGTQTTQEKFGLMMPQIITLRNNGEASPVVETPLPTFAANGNHVGMLMPMIMGLGGRQNRDEPRSLSDALPTQTATPSFGMLMPSPFLLNYYGQGGEQNVAADPLATIPATDRHALVTPVPLLVRNYTPGYSRPVTDPTGTITADDHHSLLVPPPLPAVEDCGFRMLQPHEVGRGMSFPDEYVVLGNKRDQVRQYGNAVTPPVAKMIMRRVLKTFE